MHVFKDIVSMRAYLTHHDSSRPSVGLIPTMGALHEGHISLVRASKSEDALTLCSIFVNPTQFNNQQDLDAYPRTLDDDLQALSLAGCDAVFCPERADIYPEPSQVKFDFGALDKILEGEYRPGHFSGVALVVSKLFNIIQPDRAYFGQKDFQQFMIISRLVKELNFNISLVRAPIVRHPDGLAMSSRNKRLNADERRRATVLYQCLQQVRKALLAGQPFAALQEKARELCNLHKVRLEYLALADSRNLTLLDHVNLPAQEVLLIAAYVEEVRLIDNILLAE